MVPAPAELTPVPGIDVQTPEQAHQAAAAQIENHLQEAQVTLDQPVMPVTAETPVSVTQSADKFLVETAPDQPPVQKIDRPDSFLKRTWLNIRSFFKAFIRIAPSKKALDQKISYVTKKETAKQQASPTSVQLPEAT